MRLPSVRWCFVLLLFGTSCTRGTQWTEDFSKLKLQYWTSNVQYQFVHSSKVPGLQQDNEMLLELNAKEPQARLMFRGESFSGVKNSNLVVNITVLGCKSRVTLNVSGKNILLQEPSVQNDCPDNDRIPFVFIEPIMHIDKLNMTLEVRGPRDSTSPTRHLVSGLEVFVQLAESNTLRECEKHEDFSLRKLQFWENDDLGPEVTWREDGNETLMVLNLTNSELYPRLYFNSVDKLDAKNFTVSYTIIGCKMVTRLYWDDGDPVMTGPYNCEDIYKTTLTFDEFLDMEDDLNFRLEIDPLNNATEALLSDLKVTFVARQCETPLLHTVSVEFEVTTTTAANISISVLATTENLSAVNSPSTSSDEELMMWALLIGTTAALIVVSVVVAILVCYLRHSTEIKISSPFDYHVDYCQVQTKEV